MCSSLFSRGNQACAHIANAKHTKQSQDAALSANIKKRMRLTFELARLPWQPVRFFENNSEIHVLRNNEHIFPDFMDITFWILRKLALKIDALFCPQCVQMTGIFVFPRGCRGHFYCCL